MKVELEIPKQYEKLFKGVNIKHIVEKSLREALVSEFSKELLVNLLKEKSYKPKHKLSKLLVEEFPKGRPNEKALRKLSEEVKKSIAERHGL